MSNQTQWYVEIAAMLAAVDWAKGDDRSALRLQDLADHYAAKSSVRVPQVMVRSTARLLIKDRLGVTVDSMSDDI